jgi:membrane-bound ClpP family serine protease
VRADSAELAAGGGYTSGGNTITITSSAQSAGTYSLVGNDVVFTASGGTIGPFRYTIIYNDTPTSPADPLIGWWDYGSSITLNDGETFTVDYGASILTLA